MVEKDNKVYDEFQVVSNFKETDRRELRNKVVNAFLNEKGGYWKDGIKHVSKYKYFVETLNDGRRIFLLRPTFLNKGIDFQVWVERMNGGKDDRPSHKDIFADLDLKRKENPDDFKSLEKAIDRVWNCEDPDKVLKDNSFSFQIGFPVELFLKILKWLFIEQDITYWNYDGRGMLKMAIDKEFR